MKTSRASTSFAQKGDSRRNWPPPAELGAIGSTPANAPAPGRAMSEPPVRPVPGWRLPSGQLLVEYALRAGLASSPLLVRLPLLGSKQGANAAGPGNPVGANSLSALSGKLNSARREPGRAGVKHAPKVVAGGRG